MRRSACTSRRLYPRTQKRDTARPDKQKKAAAENMKPLKTIVAATALAALGACAPEVGSQAWCEQMDETPKGDWSINDASEYAKSCILRETEE